MSASATSASMAIACVALAAFALVADGRGLCFGAFAHSPDMMHEGCYMSAIDRNKRMERDQLYQGVA